MECSRCNLASFVQTEMHSLERVWILRKLLRCIFGWQKLSDQILNSSVLRISRSKSAPSCNSFYPTGQWVNTCNTVVRDSQPITAPGLQPSDWSPLNSRGRLGGKPFSWALVEASCQTPDNTHRRTYRKQLPACWLLFADCCMCSRRNISPTDNREKNNPDGDLKFLFFLLIAVQF